MKNYLVIIINNSILEFHTIVANDFEHAYIIARNMVHLMAGISIEFRLNDYNNFSLQVEEISGAIKL